MKFEAQVKELPERYVACVRHVGPYPEIGKAIERIFQWAGPKGLVQFPKTKCLAVYRDDPKEVDVSELRSDACITVPEGTEADGDVKTMRIPGGLFAVAHVEIDVTEYGDAWDKLLGEWMPESGHGSDTDRMCYELYLNDPEQHPEKKHIVEICEPVLPK
jgi:AraC family transcriptional regulator